MVPVLLAVVIVALVAVAVGVAVASFETPHGTDVGLLTADCDEVAAQELYVQRAFQCEDGTRVVLFVDAEARDAYLAVAEHFGTVIVDRGDWWARVR